MIQRLNNFVAFLVVSAAITSNGNLNISEIFSATNLALPGSLGFPLKGTGLKYGQSVSTSIRSRGNFPANSGR